jgi:hypothetical protein
VVLPVFVVGLAGAHQVLAVVLVEELQASLVVLPVEGHLASAVALVVELLVLAVVLVVAHLVEDRQVWELDLVVGHLV